MLCTNCGAHMMDSDQFCPKCGAKAIKDRKCPDCGTVLREGTLFCHKCGRPIDDDKGAEKVPEETLGIPVDAIERNILSETAAEIKADHRKESVQRRTPSKGAASHDSVQKNKPVKNAPPQKKRVTYREEEDWEEDDWDDEEEGVDAITIMTVIVGCVILVVIAMLGYNLYRQYAPKNYEKVSEDSEKGQQEQDAGDGQQGQELTGEWGAEENEAEDVYTLTVIHNDVNVRDNPSTNGTNVLKKAQTGETYTCYGSVEGDEWYKILLDDGSIGYIFHEYVTVE